MSLLMDALRKAEADKKQALANPPEENVSDADESADDYTSSALTRQFGYDEGMDLAETVARPSRVNLTGENTNPSTTQNFADGLELSLEPLDESDAPTADMPGEDVLDVTLAADSDASSTMPTPRGVDSQLDSYFDDSQSGAKPEVDDDPLAIPESVERYGSGVTETVASAHTVFDAGSSGPSRRTVAWSATLAVVFLITLGAAGFYYFQQAPTLPALPSPTVAIDVEKAPPKLLPVVEIAQSQTKVGENLAELPAISEQTSEAPEAMVSTSPTDGVIADAAAAGTLSPSEMMSSPESESVEIPRVETEPVVASVEDVPNLDVVKPQAPEIGVRPGEVRIARAVSAIDIGATLNDAYSAYVAGDFSVAEQRYLEVLDARPSQKNALLGVAALKLRNGDVASAHRLYRKILKTDPGNPTASAAMMSIEGGTGEQASESRLKMLLDEGVDAGYIYFALGNLYARHQRWADAQQAYFEALRNHPGDPDYNYNLAVSLDRIGQRESALRYYNLAVSLADTRQAGFDTATALTRIQSINSSPN